MTQKDYLRKLELTDWGKPKQDFLEDLAERMRLRFPGNYTLACKYDATRGVFALVTEFENEEERTMWLLQYGN